jgi:hypothetical protein
MKVLRIFSLSVILVFSLSANAASETVCLQQAKAAAFRAVATDLLSSGGLVQPIGVKVLSAYREGKADVTSVNVRVDEITDFYYVDVKVEQNRSSENCDVESVTMN